MWSIWWEDLYNIGLVKVLNHIQNLEAANEKTEPLSFSKTEKGEKEEPKGQSWGENICMYDRVNPQVSKGHSQINKIKSQHLQKE